MLTQITLVTLQWRSEMFAIPSYQHIANNFYSHSLGWSGVAKVSCTLRHRGVQLMLAYSWEGLLSL